MDNVFNNNLIAFLASISTSEIISYALAAGSILIGLIAYFRTKKTQRPKYLISSATLRNEVFKNSSFCIMQGDQPLTSLTLSKFALWNTGITLHKEDIASMDPIHITTCGDVEILEVQALHANTENNFNFRISDDKKRIDFDFDYFAKDQGVVLKIFHTGRNSNSLNVNGSLKNGLKIARSQKLFRKILIQGILGRYHLPITFVAKVYGFTFLLFGLVTSISAVIRYGTTHQYGLWETLSSLVLGIFILILSAYLIRRRLPSELAKAFYGEN